MKNMHLEVGMKVEIEVIRDDQNITLPTKVEDFDGDRILLGMPFFEGKLFFLKSDELVRIYYAKNSSFYFVKARVVDKKYAPIPIIAVELLGPPEKNQRRGYFRLQVSLNVKIRPEGTENWINAYVIDLSASGAMIYFRKEIEKGQIVEIKLQLDSKELNLKAKVVRITKDPGRRISPYNMGVQFIDIEEHIRDEIIKFVLSEQRKLRKKGCI
ncbi:flagellar brake protein [Thermosediminibacter oceani]|uniref:Type IV pilus assembly PilZ n=1 Tax=Thermosediminibacter oceani (strain ATCC BAA-1034 / DSM 16646 / JW/IW-1228P) TaxID=555079 RepID=D9S3A4_THEOJ|nr:flagellar brake protein [Thermosediminibacter oceani]ADL07881.1 type IV pilus assembly PilZ [Thermosediminibacter oceani DSM 16646]